MGGAGRRTDEQTNDDEAGRARAPHGAMMYVYIWVGGGLAFGSLNQSIPHARAVKWSDAFGFHVRPPKLHLALPRALSVTLSIVWSR